MEYRKILVSMLLYHSVLLFGVIGYMITEKLSFFDSLWLAVVSMLTIGYGDLAPVTVAGKILTLCLIPVGIALITYMLAQLAGAVIGGKLSNEMRKRKMKQTISKLNDHLIVCGFGRVGQQVYAQLKQDNQPVIVIEQNPDVVKEMPDDCLFIEGNATEDHILQLAGVDRANGIIVTLPSDADNVFITLTVKGVNPSIFTVVRAEKDFSEEKLYRAGADKVINTSNISGKRMAMALLKPISAEYVDTILHDQNIDYFIEEITIKPTSPLIQLTLREAKIREKYGVNIVAIKRNKSIIGNPSASEILVVNDLLIVFGTSSQLNAFNKVTR